MRNDDGDLGFAVVGNLAGSEAPRVVVQGPERSVWLDMVEEGDNSVLLPDDAISAGEMLDEVGAGSAALDVAAIPNGGGYLTLRSATITAPAPGYALVIASASVWVTHGLGPDGRGVFGVTDDPEYLPATQQVSAWSSGGVGVEMPVTCHGIFEVSEGENTFYFLGRKFSELNIVQLYCIQLSVLYFPSAYGDIYPIMGAAAAGGSNGERDPLARERSAGTSVDAGEVNTADGQQARVDRELAAMRAEIEALRAQVESSQH
jgi:hypothetical protein